MRFNVLTGLLLAALLLVAPGCTTTQTGKPQIDPVTAEKLAPILSGSVAGAVVYAYDKNEKTEVIVDVIYVALNEFLLTPDMSPAALQAKLYNLPVPELKTAEAQMIISPLLAIYKGFADTQVKDIISRDAGLKVLIRAMVDGLQQGLEGIRQMRQQHPDLGTGVMDLESLQIIVKALESEMTVKAAQLRSS